MSTHVEILSEVDVQFIIENALIHPNPPFKLAFESFMLANYGIDMLQLERVVRQAVPEEFI